MPHDAIYEVYAVRYAHYAPRRARENFLMAALPDAHAPDAHDIPMPFDYFVWAVVGGGKTIVVDTGFDAPTAARRGRELLLPPRDGLLALGIDPASVTDVVLTHLHYDHAGNHDLFPNATYWIQDREIAYATGRHMCHPVLRLGYEAEDACAVVRKIFAGRVRCVDGAAELCPGVSLHHLGGHTKGMQCVRVRTRRGFVVLASDATHFYANLETGNPFPALWHVGEALEGFATLRRLATSDAHIIPGHDPLVMARYPVVKAGLEGKVVRLDTEPL
jgi:glyoxylase-like metal-dependent hydrolase (beta-lactamase superfamily II)